MREKLNILREFSVPLIAGIVIALVWGNVSPGSYHAFVNTIFYANLSFHFVINDLFMVLFFGMAAVEITQSCLPGGDLNPLRKAVNPLLATVGGVVGPAAVYLLLNMAFGSPALARGWGIPTATDIALAWLVASLVFGRRHPAVSFLLLLAVADDAIGLAIIAIFYPDPHFPVEPGWLMLTLTGMGAAWVCRGMKTRSYWPYVIFGGGLSWMGLFKAHLHPALALAFIVPFLPHPPRERMKVFEVDPKDRSPLARFEHEWKVIVDFGLFLFGLANAGVEFSEVGPVTWIVLLSLIVGKTAGIFLMGKVGHALGFTLPDRVGTKELLLAGLIAGIGLTVALFVAGQAFTDGPTQAAAKMGALLSAGVAGLAIVGGRLLRIKKTT